MHGEVCYKLFSSYNFIMVLGFQLYVGFLVYASPMYFTYGFHIIMVMEQGSVSG